jgi:drug/metabolite transporter (DMT)-like permease
MPRHFLKGGEGAKPAPVSRLWLGIALGVFTSFGQAVGSLLARPAMASGVEPFTAMALRSGVAAVFYVAISATPLVREHRVPVQFNALALALSAAFLGTGLGMALWMAALHGGDVGIVSTLTSTTPVLVLPMVWIRSGTRPSHAAWLGALLVIAGIALISLG